MDTKNHRIESKMLRGGWVDGKIDGYRFQAKVYDSGSEYGIDGGRVSKLAVWDERPSGVGEFISYDRGWDKKPVTDEHSGILRAILGYFKWFPTSAYWEELASQEPFSAQMRLKNGSYLDVSIAVSSGGSGTAAGLPDGVICRKLDPVTVWELKLAEAECMTPRFDQRA
jgi:hypothetical protein